MMKWPCKQNACAKRVAPLRMVPFFERNYDYVELGPRGVGKSHLYQQISPYSHLIFRRQGGRGEDVGGVPPVGES